MRVALHYVGYDGGRLKQGLYWFRQETLRTWRPCWLFVADSDQAIGLGWCGVLVIWRTP
ncbi:hypothetical protein LCGC14_2331810 [marine sediment metagenome]|uniref:Uncharacterized protein n=1 Tax=marine sediment metagenome TaxID=412755 RepID=A0A0F9D249_9ZZZZ